MRRPAWLPLAVGAALGVAFALLVTVLQPAVYRATATVVLTRPGAAPGDDPAFAAAAAAAKQLLASGVVAGSAVRNLRTGDTAQELLDRTTVTASSRSSLLDIAVEDGKRDSARRAAQELAEVFTVLYNDRFGAEARASLWDAPESRPPRVSPRPARNLTLGLLLGVLGGMAVRARVRRPARQSAPVRVVEVPAPTLLPAMPVPVPEPVPVPVPEQPATVQRFVLPDRGAWTSGDVDRLLAEHGHAFADRLAELQIYADTMRDVAGPDGRLPSGVEVVVEDVFADLIARAR